MPNYHLTELVSSLSKEELRNFKIYISRINNQTDGDSKNLQLFDYIKNDQYDEFGEELVMELYPDGNKNAFYRLKNRLINDIEQSLLMLNRNKDPRFKVYNTIQLANIFRYKSDYEQAFKYLTKAEKAAIKYGYNDLLDIIYSEILHLTGDYYKIAPEEYITKKRENYKALVQAQEVDFLIATINHRLRDNNYSSKEDFGIELEAIIESLSISEDISEDPHVQFKIHTCVRTIMLQKRDFTNLEKYLLKSLKYFEAVNYFDSARYEELFRIIHWIINCSNINFNFAQAKLYIDKLHKALLGNNKKFYDKHIWMYYESLIVHYSFTDQPEEAMKLMQEIIANPELTGTNFYDIFIPLNLSGAYYKANQVKKALDTIAPLVISKGFSKLSRLLQLRISIVDIIYHFESDDTNYVIYRLTELKRIFRKEFKQETFLREKQFISIVNDLASKPTPLSNPRIITKINQFIDGSPKSIPGNNEVVIYKFWLKAKLERRTYTDVIMENMMKDQKKVQENIPIQTN